MTEDIDLSEIDKKYKDKCSLIKAGKCKNVNIFLQQSRENAELKDENERLKEENKLIRQLHKDLSDKLFEFQKIEDALQEIKKIAKRNIFLSPKLLEINGDIGQIQNIAITQILDLITKAEEE